MSMEVCASVDGLSVIDMEDPTTPSALSFLSLSTVPLVEYDEAKSRLIVTLEDAIETLLGREIVDESDAVADMQVLARDKHRERLESVEEQ